MYNQNYFCSEVREIAWKLQRLKNYIQNTRQEIREAKCNWVKWKADEEHKLLLELKIQQRYKQLLSQQVMDSHSQIISLEEKVTTLEEEKRVTPPLIEALSTGSFDNNHWIFQQDPVLGSGPFGHQIKEEPFSCHQYYKIQASTPPLFSYDKLNL